jgi:cyclopropane-fatty-acyl-phospholipid synthase
MKSNIVPSTAVFEQPAERPSLLAQLGRKALFAMLSRIQRGEICLIDVDGRHHFGRKTDEYPLQATLTVQHPQFYVQSTFGGTVGVGESYINGYWRCDSLTDLVRIIIANREVVAGIDRGLAAVGQPLLRLAHWLHRNTRRGSARNIAAHYDLGNDLYKLMLDETMAYSCGIFTSENATLADASRAKFDAVCRKLQLGPADHLLEIGTGWGGLAIHAAQHYGCQVTTTTISRAQHDYAAELIGRLGLRDRITLLLEDYRDLKGRYDKLVSIEMVEAVGARFLDTYLAKCASLLKDSGAMVLQAITVQDQFYERGLRTVDFIQRFVFPGSFIPCVSAITDSVKRISDMKLFHLEDIGVHYARTLATWRRNFLEHLQEVKQQGYPERFVRLWEFYLSYCEAGFAERRLGDVQMLLTKPGFRGAVATA